MERRGRNITDQEVIHGSPYNVEVKHEETLINYERQVCRKPILKNKNKSDSDTDKEEEASSNDEESDSEANENTVDLSDEEEEPKANDEIAGVTKADE